MIIWKNIKEHDGYQVSNDGQVRSFRKRNSIKTYETPKILKQQICTTHCKKQYSRVNLFGKQTLVHRLVADHFIENIHNKPQVNHKDGNGLNNNVLNLEWVTNSENQNHRFKMNGTKNNLGQYVHKNRTTFRVEKRGVINKCFKTLQEAQTFAKQYY